MRTPDHTPNPPRRRLEALLDCLVDPKAVSEATDALEAVLARQADRHDPELLVA